MKNQTLSISQMRHLKELGVDTSKASMVLIAKDESGNEVCWEDLSFKEDTGTWLCESWDEESDEPCRKEAYLDYLDAENGDYDHSYREDCGVFTLQDILDLLPKEVKTDTDTYWLTISIYDCKEWYVCYSMSDEFDYYKEFKSEYLLEAACQMLCWCAESGYLKGGEK